MTPLNAYSTSSPFYYTLWVPTCSTYITYTCITTSFFETQYVKTLCTGSSFTDDDVIFFCFFFIHGSRLQMGRLSVDPPSNVGVFFLFFRGGFIAALAVATATLPRSSQPLIAFVLRSREPTTSPCAQNGRKTFARSRVY